MNHPDPGRLALLAGGDLSFWLAMPVRLHVRSCERCQAELWAFRRTRQVVGEAAKDLPPGLEWNRLSEEMTGNIRVGLAAGECVGGYRVRPGLFHWRWNGALAAGLLTGIFVLGFWLNLPGPQADHLLSALERIAGRGAHKPAPLPSDVLLASQQGIEARGTSTSLSYVPPDTGAVVVSVSTRGSAAARAMDDDTGQTTITEVYDAR
ncbi:MAG: hypothetical protein ABSF98_15130 [Bryobacteraceae bacterium]